MLITLCHTQSKKGTYIFALDLLEIFEVVNISKPSVLCIFLLYKKAGPSSAFSPIFPASSKRARVNPPGFKIHGHSTTKTGVTQTIKAEHCGKLHIFNSLQCYGIRRVAGMTRHAKHADAAVVKILTLHKLEIISVETTRVTTRVTTQVTQASPGILTFVHFHTYLNFIHMENNGK